MQSRIRMGNSGGRAKHAGANTHRLRRSMWGVSARRSGTRQLVCALVCMVRRVKPHCSRAECTDSLRRRCDVAIMCRRVVARRWEGSEAQPWCAGRRRRTIRIVLPCHSVKKYRFESSESNKRTTRCTSKKLPYMIGYRFSRCATLSARCTSA